MNKYLKLIQANTPYAKRMTRLRNRIFGDVVRSTDKASMRVVKMFSEEPIYLRDYMINYYPRHRELNALTTVLRHHGLFRDEHVDFKLNIQKLRELRGKGVPKKIYDGTRWWRPDPKKHPLENIPLKIYVDLK